MKRIQQLLTLLIICVLCSSLVLTVSAHPGKTDSNGGHTDSDTGDYHYHHGYQAHDHYDMDGDGDIDCPYSFDDQTGTNSGRNESDNNYSITKEQVTPLQTNPPISLTESNNIKEGKEVPAWIYWIIGGLALTLFACVLIITEKNKELSSMQNRYNSYTKKTRELLVAAVDARYMHALDNVKRSNEKMLASLPPSAKVNFRDPFPLDFYEEFDNSSFPFDLPYGVTITKNGEAALGNISNREPYGRYTVYITFNGRCYHESPFCKFVTHASPVCIFTAMKTKKPCSYCHPISPSSIPQWYQNILSRSRELGINWNDNRKQEEAG